MFRDHGAVDVGGKKGVGSNEWRFFFSFLNILYRISLVKKVAVLTEKKENLLYLYSHNTGRISCICILIILSGFSLG